MQAGSEEVQGLKTLGQCWLGNQLCTFGLQQVDQRLEIVCHWKGQQLILQQWVLTDKAKFFNVESAKLASFPKGVAFPPLSVAQTLELEKLASELPNDGSIPAPTEIQRILECCCPSYLAIAQRTVLLLLDKAGEVAFTELQRDVVDMDFALYPGSTDADTNAVALVVLQPEVHLQAFHVANGPSLTPLDASLEASDPPPTHQEMVGLEVGVGGAVGIAYGQGSSRKHASISITSGAAADGAAPAPSPGKKAETEEKKENTKRRKPTAPPQGSEAEFLRLVADAEAALHNDVEESKLLTQYAEEVALAGGLGAPALEPEPTQRPLAVAFDSNCRGGSFEMPLPAQLTSPFMIPFSARCDTVMESYAQIHVGQSAPSHGRAFVGTFTSSGPVTRLHALVSDSENPGRFHLTDDAVVVSKATSPALRYPLWRDVRVSLPAGTTADALASQLRRIAVVCRKHRCLLVPEYSGQQQSNSFMSHEVKASAKIYGSSIIDIQEAQQAAADLPGITVVATKAGYKECHGK